MEIKFILDVFVLTLQFYYNWNIPEAILRNLITAVLMGCNSWQLKRTPVSKEIEAYWVLDGRQLLLVFLSGGVIYFIAHNS